MEALKTIITTSPHLHEGSSTRNVMLAVVLCLLPSALWGVYVFGIYSLIVLMATIITCLVTEFIIARLLGRITLSDGSALVTGLLLGMNMPPSVPIFIPVIASVFAIAVVKITFGGLGRNWMNPALGGRVFVMFSWPGFMNTWLAPRTWGKVDAVTQSSPLGFIKAGLLDYQGSAGGPIEFLSSHGYAGGISPDIGWMHKVLDPIVGIFPEGYGDFFIGNIPGCIGEVSALLLLFGTIYLFIKKIITWEIPVSYLLSFSLLVLIFGGRRFGSGFFHGDVFFHLLSGGLILGVFYMATDMVTSPLTRNGMIIFGVGAGFLTFLIRLYGSLPEGVSLAIIIMNMFVPLINRITRPVKFGFIEEGKK